ncbi:MAG TPA: DNA polymerase Y family protein [Spongiibacteraceae bacterium]|nr:DNA polymerase Y family protein [Spongiibacteraceae bacterium]HUH38423.1 DNA polymerase Y family protein [Spongiibacteraceae bacterium]
MKSTWLCLHFPLLPLERLTQPLPATEQGPLAISAGRRLLLVNAAATAQGVSAGVSAATARALCPALRIETEDPDGDRQALAQLAIWAYRYTPAVSLAPAHSLLLDIGGSLRLFRGLQALLEGMAQALQTLDHAVVRGLGRTPEAAWLLARRQHALPVAAWGLDDAACTALLEQVATTALPLGENCVRALQGLGLHTLGDLLALPNPALGRRLGSAWVDYRERLLGLRADPRPLLSLPGEFRHHQSLLDPVTNQRMLLALMQHQLEQLCHYLRASQQRCGGLHWRLHYPRGHSDVDVSLAQADHRPAIFLDLTRLRLERQQLNEPVLGLSLEALQLQAQAIPPSDLFAESGASHPVADFTSRLRARLGEHALQTLTLQPHHWPEHASRSGTEADCASLPPDFSAPRPAWLLTRAVALQHTADGQLHWAGCRLTLLRGPERISPPWWQQDLPARDYYTARRDDGVLCWVYQALDQGNWFAHGLFA